MEESRISKPTEEGKQPEVHSHFYRIKGFDPKEIVDRKERQLRIIYRPIPEFISYSVFMKHLENGKYTTSFIESYLHKSYRNPSWSIFFTDLRDRRDIASYVKSRFALW